VGATGQSKMRSFQEIYDIASARKGGDDALQALLADTRVAVDLAAIPDDRWLSNFTRCVFQAGFSWKVIEAKWDGFEAAFHRFDVARCAMMDDDWFDDLLRDTRIVRNGMKIQTVRDNAVFLSDLAKEHGSAGNFFATWPSDDFVGLLKCLKTRGSRLGAATGQYALRFIGMDSFILSADVTARLIAEGIVSKSPTSARDMVAVQTAFNTWRAQSGRGLSEISRVLAMSVG